MNNFAISSVGIGDALQRSAAALASAGNTIDESIGLVTGMNAVIQNPDSVGTALKTVSMYLRAAKTDAEAAGIETDGMAGSVSELRDELLALSGIDITMADGQTFKSTYDIMEELSGVWDKMSDISQANVLNLIGGKRNANVIASLITNFEDAANAMKSAQEAAGSATLENEKYLESINGKISQLRANFEALSTSLLDSDWFGGVADVANAFLEVLTVVSDIHALIPGIVIGIANMNKATRSSTVTDTMSSIMTAIQVGQANSNTNEQIIASLLPSIDKLNIKERELLATRLMSAKTNGEISAGFADQVLQLGNMTTAVKNVGQAAQTSGKGVGGFFTKMFSSFTTVESILMSTTTVLSILSAANDIYTNIQQGYVDTGDAISSAYEKSTASAKDNIAALSDMRAEFDVLSAGVGENGENISLTAEEYERYNELLQQIVTISPSVAHSYDGERLALQSYTDVIGQAIAAQRELQAESEKTYMERGSASDLFKGWGVEYGEYTKDAGSEWSRVASVFFSQLDDIGVLTGALNDIGVTLEPFQDVFDLSEDQLRVISQRSDDLYASIRQRWVSLGKDLNSESAVISDEMVRSAISQFSKSMEPVENVVEEQARYITDYFQYWSQHGDNTGFYAAINDIPLDALDEFENGLKSVIDPQASFNQNTKYAKEYLEDFVGIMQSDAGKGLKTYSDRLHDNAISMDEYNSVMNTAKPALLAMFGDTPVTRAVIDFFTSQTNAVDQATDSMNKYVKSAVKFPNAVGDVYKSISDGNEIVGTALTEMLTDGGISGDTFNAVLESMKEGEDVWDYVTRSGGKLQLDTAKYLQRSIDLHNQNVDALTRESRALEYQAETYERIASAVEMRDQGDSDGAKARLARELEYMLGEGVRYSTAFSEQEVKDAGWQNIEDAYATIKTVEKDADGVELEIPFAIMLTPTESKKQMTEVNGQLVEQTVHSILSPQAVDTYVAEMQKRAAEIVKQNPDISPTQALFRADMDTEHGGKNLFIEAFGGEIDSDFDAAIAAADRYKGRYNEYMKAYLGIDDYADSDAVSTWATQAREQSARVSDVLNSYNASVAEQIKQANQLGDKANLQPMWTALDTIAERGKVFLEGARAIEEGGKKLSFGEITDMFGDIPELANDQEFFTRMLSAESAEDQLAVIDDYQQKYESAYDSIISTQINALSILRDNAYAQSKDLYDKGLIDQAGDMIAKALEYENLIAMLSSHQDETLPSLFPADTEIKSDVEQMQEAIETVQKYRDLRNAINEDAAKQGKLSEDTISSLVEVFGTDYADALNLDETGKLLGANEKTFNSWYIHWVEGLNKMEGAAAWLTGGFVSLLSGMFKSVDKDDVSNLDKMSESMNKFSQAGEFLKEGIGETANSVSALNDLIELGKNFGFDEDKISGFFSIGEGGINIKYDEFRKAIEGVIDTNAEWDESQKSFYKSLLNTSGEVQTLTDKMGELGGYTDLLGAIMDEQTDGGFNTLDTLASYIETAEALGADWSKNVSWGDNGPIISTAGALDLINAQIDKLIPAGAGATAEMIQLNAAFKQQAAEAVKAAETTKTIADMYDTVQAAVSTYSDVSGGQELTYDTYQKLIEANSAFADAVTYSNGVMTINQERFEEVTDAMILEAEAMALQEAALIENDDRYKDLIDRYGELDDAERTELANLEAKIQGYRTLASELRNSGSALNTFAQTDKSDTTQTFGQAQDAWSVVDDVLNNKDSGLYGQIGSDAYQNAMRALMPEDFAEGTKEYEASMKRLEEYFGADTPLAGVHAFKNDLEQLGMLADGELNTDLFTLADTLGLTAEAVAAMITQTNRYLDPENQIQFDPIYESLEETARKGEEFSEAQKEYAVNEDLVKGTEEYGEAVNKVNEYLSEGGAEQFAKDIAGSVDDSGNLTKSFADIGKELGVSSDFVGDMVNRVNELRKESGEPLITPMAGDTAGAETDQLDQLITKLGEVNVAYQAVTNQELVISTGGTQSALAAVIAQLNNVKTLVESMKSLSFAITGSVTVHRSIVGGGSSGGGDSNPAAANARGTISSAGGRTLVGELGMETVVDPEKGEYYTVGERGAEFVDLPKGAIVFDDQDTRDLFAGREATNLRKRGKAFATGTRNQKLHGLIKDLPSLQEAKKSSSSRSDSGSSSSGNTEKDKSALEELLDKYEELIKASEHLIEHQEYLFDVAEHGLDFVGMGDSLEEQARLYRKMMDDAQAGINEMVAAGAEDTDEELQKIEEAYWDAHRNLYDILDEINELYTDALNDKIDGIQDAFQSLVDAADELSSGNLSTDMFQELLDNGIEYMSLLDKVGDTYVLNEERLQDMLAAEREQLSVESALSYINRLTAAAADDSAEKLANLVNLTNNIGESSWDVVYAQAEALKELGVTEDQYQIIINNIEAMRDLAGKTLDDLSKDRDDLYKDQRDAIEYIYDKTKELLEFELEERIEALEDQIDAYNEIIDKKIELLDLTKEEGEYADDIAERTKEIAKMQTKIDQLSLDDSREAQAERAKLIEEMTELQKELSEAQKDHAHDLQVEALEKDAEDFEEATNKEIEKLEELLSSEEKLHQAALERIENGWETLYQELIDWNYEHGNVLNEEITENWEVALLAAQKYGSYIAALKEFNYGNPEVSFGGNVIDADSLPHYHTGGTVDGRGAINEDEVLAVLKQNELVLEEGAREGVFEVVDFVQELSKRLGTKIGNIASPMRSAIGTMMGSTSASGQLFSVGGNSNETFAPVFNVSIAHTGNMTDADAMNYGRRIANTALDTLYDAFRGRGISDALTRQRL